MILKEVAVSGTVGKRITTTSGQSIKLRSLTLTPSGANATIKIREGLSGTVFFARATSANGSMYIPFSESIRFDTGLHVTVIGTNAVAYLELD